jgi:hypothetical protein
MPPLWSIDDDLLQDGPEENEVLPFGALRRMMV